MAKSSGKMVAPVVSFPPSREAFYVQHPIPVTAPPPPAPTMCAGCRVREIHGAWEGTIIGGAGPTALQIMVLVDGDAAPVPHLKTSLMMLG